MVSAAVWLDFVLHLLVPRFFFAVLTRGLLSQNYTVCCAIFCVFWCDKLLLRGSLGKTIRLLTVTSTSGPASESAVAEQGSEKSLQREQERDRE